MRKLVMIILFILMMSACAGASSDFLSIPPQHTINYYDAYGTPSISASMISDPEFEKGETRAIEINLANKGIVYSFKLNTAPDKPREVELAKKEMEMEKMRTAAYGLKVELTSTTSYIEIKPETSVYTMDAIKPGMVLEKPLKFIIDVKKNAHAGRYLLELPVSYQYRNQVRTATGEEVMRGVADRTHASYYKKDNKTIEIPVTIKKSAQFRITNASGKVPVSDTGTINITYKNIGETTAEDASARLIIMDPLSTEKPAARLGDVGPGENATASFKLSASTGAVPKNHSMTTNVKYFDDGYLEFSQPLDSKVTVTSPDKWLDASTFLSIIIAVMVTYLIFDTLKSRRKNE
ncbi:COG1361 S-layer family protein [Methanohalobium sp.]|uniref:COG1361 S-layer family protein n=1 Tax=Methanohalobium sp. TaxID=2837493 RepID=UPI0025D68C1E|nr:hypothetical protein [Methanohalobium sp.]